MTTQTDSHNFQAEVSRLLHMMVHSVYSEREIFLRELISNAADACDKLRYLSVLEPDLLQGDGADFKITLHPDKQKSILTVTDNGIGMTREELIENLGTIARSGTKAFMEQYVTDKDDTGDGDANEGKAQNTLIGQFGVGFYAAFIVADHVDVVSRHVREKETWKWSSDGASGFTMEQVPDDEAPTRGTVITLHIKEDAQKFLEGHELESIVRTYSDHISFPIELITLAEKKEGDETEAESPEDTEGLDVRQINSSGALWSRPKSEITEEQYTEFYHYVGGVFDNPAHTIHYSAEGLQTFTVLAFIPESKPFDLFEPSRASHVKLYVRKIFISDKAELLPSYLRFMRGIIDSEDIPLNLSREMLQNNPAVDHIRNAVTKRIIKELARLATRNENNSYDKIWENFGAVIKEGLYEDMARRDDLYEICRFKSTEGTAWRSLKEYVANMKEGQNEIYYLTGEDENQMRNSPLLEGYKARDIEVLLLSDPVDSFWTTTAVGFDGKNYRSITQGEVDLSAIPSNKDDELDQESADEVVDTTMLVARLQEILASKVEKVRVSQRLVDSPVCLVAPDGAPDRVLEKLLQHREDGLPKTRPVLEINAKHKLLKTAADKLHSDPDAVKDFAWILLDEAKILEGGTPDDPAEFAKRLNRLLEASW